MANPKPLDSHQQDLINVVKAAHQTLAVAHKTRSAELERRLKQAKIDAERYLNDLEIRAKLALETEMAIHQSNLDEALIAAYDGGVPVRRIALDGFGNQFDGGVKQRLAKLRADDRLGTRVGFQSRQEDAEVSVEFPKPVNIAEVLTERTTIQPPQFFKMEKPVVLLEADPSHNQPEIAVDAVRLVMDDRDPYFKQIAGDARPGTPYKHATDATLYFHPATGDLVAAESAEHGRNIWDHPVARWVKDHYEEASRATSAALKTKSA